MATEIVTAKAGTNHVDSEDIGALYAGGFGKGRYALNLGNNLKCSMRDANTLVIDTGGIMFDGRFVRVKSAESLTVTNGTQSQYRKDLAVLTYKRDASNNNIESVSWSVLRGTPASSKSEAKAPTFTEGSILDGDATAVLAVAEVDLAGLTPSCKLLLPTVTSLATLGDSVSQIDFEIITKDTIKLYGIVVNGMALITVHWTNNGGFLSHAWGDTPLARIKGLKAVHELHSVFIDNIGDPANQSSRYLHVVNNGVYFRTAYECTVPAGKWHMGHIAVPVTTA